MTSHIPNTSDDMIRFCQEHPSELTFSTDGEDNRDRFFTLPSITKRHVLIYAPQTLHPGRGMPVKSCVNDKDICLYTQIEGRRNN